MACLKSCGNKSLSPKLKEKLTHTAESWWIYLKIQQLINESHLEYVEESKMEFDYVKSHGIPGITLPWKQPELCELSTLQYETYLSLVLTSENTDVGIKWRLKSQCESLWDCAKVGALKLKYGTADITKQQATTVTR